MKREKIFEILENNGWDMSIPEVTDAMKGDRNLILEAIKNDGLRDEGSNIEYANKRLLNDKKFILRALDYSSYILEYTPPKINDDKDIILKAVQSMGSAVQYASDKLKKNKKIGLKSVQMEGTAIQFLNDKLIIKH